MNFLRDLQDFISDLNQHRVYLPRRACGKIERSEDTTILTQL